MVPNLYVAIICQLYCLLDRLFVVDTFRNFENAKKVAIGAGSVDAIFGIANSPELALGVATVSRCGCRAGVEISGALTAPLMI